MNGGNNVDGILLIDKPPDFTSFDVVAKMRGMLQTRKIGHGGTLDPMATGVLPLFAGRATKACDMLPIQDKRYTATFCLGKETDTQDITGQIMQEKPVTAGRMQVELVLGKMIGMQEQLPPMYSAVKVGGQRLYDLARKGVEVERKTRSIEIYSIGLLNADEKNHSYTIDVACSKGTYIRTLCHDVGQILGCGGVLTQLRRTEACGYKERHCLTIDEAQKLASEGSLTERLLPVESGFQTLDRLNLDPDQARLFSNGVRLSLKRMGLQELAENQEYTVFGPDGSFLAVAFADREKDSLIMKKWFGKSRI